MWTRKFLQFFLICSRFILEQKKSPADKKWKVYNKESDKRICEPFCNSPTFQS